MTCTGSNTVLITGANGFTGRHACERFTSKGYEVAAIVRPNSAYERVNDVQYYFCNLQDRGSIEQLVERIQPQYVLHLAGRNSVPESWREPLQYMESNVMATLYLLDAVRKYSSARVLIAGSSLKFRLVLPMNPTHPYGLSKSIQEAAALAWGYLFDQDVVMTETANLIGPGPSTGICALLARYITQVERGKEVQAFRLSSTEATRDFVDIRDAVDAYEILLRRGEKGQIYTVGTGVERSLGELAASMRRLTDCHLNIEEDRTGVADTTVGIKINDPSAVLSLGWRPHIPWEESLSDILQYFRRRDEL